MAGSLRGGSLNVRAALTRDEIDAAQALRVRVFCEEQGVSREAELDGLDQEALHLVALDAGAVVATCRLRFSGGECKLERMAVEKALRARGIGRSLLEAAEAEARNHAADRIVLHAQVRAVDFYERAGYRRVSNEILVEDGIDHLRVEKELDR